MTSNISQLPAALSMQMPITSRIQMLKRRSRSLSDSSSFSLPFKKRRFVIISDNEEDDHRSFSLSPTSQRETMVTSPTLGVNSILDKGIACITPVPNTLKERQVSLVPKEIPKLLVCEEIKAKTIVSEPMQTRRRSKNSAIASSIEAFVVDTNRQSKRMSHPRLDSPLPNGCHGKTSRTQSFCRRGPNYNGSNYCKLHYFDPRYKSTIQQQQEETTKNSKNEVSISDTAIAKVKGTNDQSDAPLRNENESIAAAKTNSSNKNDKELDGLVSTRNKSKQQDGKRVPRDKLYRGDQDGSGAVEVRCLAISTRGKRCCYAAVTSNGNEYCHRHSSFFKGSENKNNIGTDKNKTRKTDTNNMEESLARDSLNTTSSSRRNRSSTTSKAALAVDPRSPNALSDLSTDLWQNRRVMVSKGPHQSKIGTVLRWRNGWVTVELLEGKTKSKNPVFHNRRSYELILV